MKSLTQTLIRLAVFLLACFLLYKELWGSAQDTTRDPALIWNVLQGEQAYLLYITLFLVPVNWGIEAIKWQRLITPLQRVSFLRAFAAVISGTTLGLFTPNRTGEFLGRVMFLKPDLRVKGSFASVLGSLSQLVVTIVLGTTFLGVFLILGHPSPLKGQFVNRALMVLAFSSGAIALTIYFIPSVLVRAIEHISFLGKWRKEAEVLSTFHAKQLLDVLALSTLRYLVFAAQFVIALIAGGLDVELSVLLLSVPIIYLINTLVPSMILTELAIRSAVAVELFKPFGAEPSVVLFASLAIWIFNILLPALIGAFVFLFKGDQHPAEQ